MKVTLKTAFSILDGRLSTEVGDVYLMLNYIFSDSFMTHQLPAAMRMVKKINPKWFSEAVEIIEDIKRRNKTNDFVELMKIIDNQFPEFEIELQKIDCKITFTDGLFI